MFYCCEAGLLSQRKNLTDTHKYYDTSYYQKAVGLNKQETGK